MKKLKKSQSITINIILMTQLKPSQIYFTHTKLSNKFTGCGKELVETLHELIDGTISIDSIPKIKVYYYDTGKEIKYLSENNRRLWVFKQLESNGLIDEISVRLEKTTNPRYLTNSYSLNAKIIG